MGGMDSVLIHNRKMGPRDWAVDVAVALAAFAFGAVQLMVSASLILPDEALRRMLGIEAVVPATSSFIALALTTFPLVARRKSPWLVFVFTLVAFVGLQNSFHGSMLAVFGPMVALFTIVVECSRIEMGVACAASALGLAAATYGGTSAALWFWVYVQNLVLMVVSALGGLAVCAHRDSVRATEQRAEEAERTREEVAARRVEEERVRIAREVHDITAHSLSAVSIQTAAAERLIDRDPAAAREAVSLAHETAKEALEEIRAMIGVLKTGDSSAETTPTEGTARLMDLADYLQEAGLQRRSTCRATIGKRRRRSSTSRCSASLARLRPTSSAMPMQKMRRSSSKATARRRRLPWKMAATACWALRTGRPRRADTASTA